MVLIIDCVVPENIHTTPMEGFFGLNLHPSRNSSLGSYFALKILAFQDPLLLGISRTLCGGDMDIFWNHTFKDPEWVQNNCSSPLKGTMLKTCIHFGWKSKRQITDFVYNFV